MSSITKHHPKVYFTFGRFQPPTIGHQVLINKLAELSKEEADAYVFVSSKQNDMVKYKKSKIYKSIKEGKFESTDLNENPLPVDLKVATLKKMYPDSPVTFIDTTAERCPQLFNILDVLKSAGYTDITMGVGSDRVETFTKVLKSSGVSVVSLGERSVNSTNMTAKAMSGTKMREAAIEGNKEKFLRGVMIGSMTESDAIGLMNAIRINLEFPAIVEGGSSRKTRRIRIKRNKRPTTYKLRDDEKIVKSLV